MSLDYAIMGFLYLKPMSGYELKKAFDESVRHFWPADQSQIYKTLANLRKSGWVDQQIETHEDRPNSKIYSLTEPGKKALIDWLSHAQPMPEMRAPWLIQLFFAGFLPDQDVVRVLEEIKDQLQGALAFVNGFALQNDACEQLRTRDAFYQMLTLDYGLTMMSALHEWAERSIARAKAEEYKGDWSWTREGGQGKAGA